MIGGVLNHHLFNYFYTERLKKVLPPVTVTRSRAYMKNDNAHVEQRNDSLVRKYLGYERMEFTELIPLLNNYYAQVVCPLVNFFMPSFKLTKDCALISEKDELVGIFTTVDVCGILKRVLEKKS